MIDNYNYMSCIIYVYMLHYILYYNKVCLYLMPLKSFPCYRNDDSIKQSIYDALMSEPINLQAKSIQPLSMIRACQARFNFNFTQKNNNAA